MWVPATVEADKIDDAVCLRAFSELLLMRKALQMVLVLAGPFGNRGCDAVQPGWFSIAPLRPFPESIELRLNEYASRGSVGFCFRYAVKSSRSNV